MSKKCIALPFIFCALTGCTTVVESNPSRTATEELLISTAAERAVAQLDLHMAPNTSIFVDGSNFEGTDSKYAMGAIRTGLLKQNLRIVDDKKKAQVIVEARAGALSTDRKDFLIGIPSFNIPIPLASAPVGFPQIALYGTEDQKGVAKFALTAYDAQAGNMIAAQDPQYGYAHNTKKTLLIFYSWTDTDVEPEPEQITGSTATKEATPATKTEH